MPKKGFQFYMESSGINKIIIFGCGIIGHEALTKLGGNNILCFCDNNKSLHNTTRWGKSIISLEKLKDMGDNQPVVLVCAAHNKAYNIAVQLDEAGISNYWIYLMIKKDIAFFSSCEMTRFLYNRELMLQMRIQLYKNKILELGKQLDYMKRHADIKTMKPATGSLRQRQMDTAELGEFICNSLDSTLNIKPFLIAGGLIGYVRHNGFIPCDDDLDFGLIREEYERLYQYCLMNQDDNGIIEFAYSGKVEKLKFIMKYNFCTLILLRYINGEDKSVSVEFFSYDYYADDYLLEDYLRDSRRIKIDSASFENEDEKINFVRTEIKKNNYIVNKSGLIFYGFDNMESTLEYNKGRMIPENVIFPLKRVLFEEKELWIPNNAEEYLSYEFDNIWEFPDDVGIPGHIDYLQPV